MLHWLRGVLLENGWSCVWLGTSINCAAVTLVTAYKVWNTLKDVSLYVLWVRRKKWKRLNSSGTTATAKCWPWNMEVGAFILKLDMGDEWHLWMALYIYIYSSLYMQLLIDCTGMHANDLVLKLTSSSFFFYYLLVTLTPKLFVWWMLRGNSEK